MNLAGRQVGPTRLPLETLTAAETAELRDELEVVGFFEKGRT